MKSAYRDGSGFTTLELMVTLTLLSAILMITIPSLTSLVREARLAAASDDLVAGLRLARSEAIKRRRDTIVCASQDANSANSCPTTQVPWSGGWIVSDGPSVIARTPLSAGLQIDVAAGPAPMGQVAFMATSGSAMVAADWRLCAPGAKAQIVTLASSGRIGKRITSEECT